MNTRWIAIAAVAAVVASAPSDHGQPKDKKRQPHNKVYPNPKPPELADQKAEIVMAARYSKELPEEVVGRAAATTQRFVGRFLRDAGANTIETNIRALGKAHKAAESGGSLGELAGADAALLTQVTRYHHAAEYDPPSGHFKSEEELASEPGTCTHEGEIRVQIKAFDFPGGKLPFKTLSLEHRGEMEQQDFDEECPIEEERLKQLLEAILEEALPCIEVSLKNQFAPRGYIEEHRVSAAGGRHIFKSSLGKENGAKPSLEIVIFRAQHMTTEEGRKTQAERRIAEGTITNEIGPGHSWISVDVGAADDEILAGDVVRAVYATTFTENLGFGQCDDIVTIEGPR